MAGPGAPAAVHRVPPRRQPPAAAAWRGADTETRGLLPAAPAEAWQETETETRGLLKPPAPAAPARRLQAGLALGVWPARPKHALYTIAPSVPAEKLPPKTKYQKRKEKLIAIFRPPYFVLSTIVIMVGVHMFAGKDVRAQLEWVPGEWWREPWRLVSYGWVHANDTHLALNALMALAVGWVAEREQGWRRAAAAWAAGLAAGALGAGVLQPAVRVVGASAAVYALLTAHLPNVALRFGHIPLWWFRPLSVVVLATSEGCWMLLHAPDAPAPIMHAQVAWAAHICGALVGIPIGFIVFTGENKSKPWVRYARVASVLVLAVALAACAAYYARSGSPAVPRAPRELAPRPP